MKMMIMKSLLISRDSIYDSYRECQKNWACWLVLPWSRLEGIIIITTRYRGEDGEPIYTYDARTNPDSSSRWILCLALLLKMHDKKYCQKNNWMLNDNEPSSPAHWSEAAPRGFGSRARLVTAAAPGRQHHRHHQCHHHRHHHRHHQCHHMLLIWYRHHHQQPYHQPSFWSLGLKTTTWEGSGVASTFAPHRCISFQLSQEEWEVICLSLIIPISTLWNKCNLCFLSQTRNSLVQLSLLVPPSQVTKCF